MFSKSSMVYVVAVAVVLCVVTCVYAAGGAGVGEGVSAGQKKASVLYESTTEFSVGVDSSHEVEHTHAHTHDAARRIGVVDMDHSSSYQHPPSDSTKLSELHYSLLATVPHDETCFSQGIQYYTHTPTASSPGTTVLYESCGLYGKSNVRIVNPHTGEVLKKSAIFPARIFSEGIVVLPSPADKGQCR